MLYTDRVKDAIAVLKTDLEEMNDLSSDPEMDRAISDLKVHLDDFLDACVESPVEQEEEEEGEAELFDLRHRQLVGLAEEIAVLARKRPEQPCRAFKAEQVNLVLRPLKDEMEADMGTSLPLVPEDGSLSYSDVAVLLRSYQDVCASYVRRHYNGNPPVIPPVPSNWTARLIQDQILVYCTDEPKSVLQIGDMLGYKDKKTVRKYLNPLLDRGLLARTVPDKPNSRNQRYITARNV